MVKGKVTKLTNFGVFVELEPGLEGLLHISELADHKVDSPEEVVKVGDEIEVKILRVDRGERKIGLSRKKAQWTKPGEGEEPDAGAEARPDRGTQARTLKELKGGLGGGGPLFFSIGQPRPNAETVEDVIRGHDWLPRQLIRPRQGFSAPRSRGRPASRSAQGGSPLKPVPPRHSHALEMSKSAFPPCARHPFTPRKS